jgi:hypothetical protein
VVTERNAEQAIEELKAYEVGHSSSSSSRRVMVLVDVAGAVAVMSRR